MYDEANIQWWKKKSYVGDQKLRDWTKCFVRKETVFSPHALAFLLIKRKINYKAKFSTNLILKKNQQK
jgi:hypothetical protein